MIKFTDRISKVLAVIFGFFTCVTISCIFSSYIGFGKYLGLHTKDNIKLFVTYSMNILGGILISFGILAVFRLINKCSRKGIIVLSLVLFSLFGGILFFILINYNTIPNTDSFFVNDYAISMVKGKHNVIDGGIRYFAKYSNNNPIVILLFFIYSVADFVGVNDLFSFGRFVNAVAIMGAEVLFFFAIKKLTGKLTTAVKFLLLSLLYPPLLLMVSWVYTATLCLPFMGGIFLAGASLYRTKKKSSLIVNSAVAGVLTVAGYNIRPVVMILSIAFFICLVLWTLRSKERLKKFLTITVTGIIFAVGTFACCTALNNHYYTGSERNFPLIHWVAMGLTNDGTFDINLSLQNEKLENQQKIKENCRRYISKAINQYTPKTFIKHMYKKHSSMWGDGSLGFPSRIGSIKESAFGAEYLIGGKSEFLYIYCQMFWACLNILCILFAVSFILNKQKNYSFVLLLTMIGAIIFYMIWEVKNVYALPFLYFITAMAVSGGESGEKFFDLSRKKRNNISRLLYVGVAIFSIVIMLIASPYLTYQVKKSRTPLLSVGITYKANIKDIAREKKTVTQSFYINEKFNRIQIYYDYTGVKDNKGKPPVYFIGLFNSDKKLIGKKILDFSETNAYPKSKIHSITAKRENLRKLGCVKIKLKKYYQPKAKEKLTIKITGKGDYDTLSFNSAFGETLDSYRGELKINGEKQNKDLRISVQQSKKEPLTTIPVYISLCFFVISLELLTYKELFCGKSNRETLNKSLYTSCLHRKNKNFIKSTEKSTEKL
ncbi:MAG: hypothetical protein MSH11_02600 [Ruminococcus sp.]|nr:hypothetical protein [Ruminococcus sp.]